MDFEISRACRQSRARRHWRRAQQEARRLAVAALLVVAACYKPDFSTAIYRCDGEGCPEGQICSQDKVCIFTAAEGCKQGGVQASADQFICPGSANACASGFLACLSSDPNLACSGAVPDLRGIADTDMGPPISCLVCCRK